MSVSVSMNSLKGGVGKTTCAILFSRMLAELGYSVLMVDLDPQYSLTSFYFEGEPPPDRSLLSYLTDKKVKAEDVFQPVDNIRLLGSSVDLIDYNIAKRLRRNSYALRDRFARDGVFDSFDYIVIDTPPTFSFLNSLALPLVDRIYVVTIPEVWSVRAVGLYLETLKEFTSRLDTRYTDVHLLVNRYDRRQSADNRTLAALEEEFAEYYAAPPIPHSKALRNFLLYKKHYKNYFHRVEEPMRRIVSDTLRIQT
jgi:cellulose biosynthesis protein BcsQ